MARRLLLGLVEGLVIGCALAVAAARGLGPLLPNALLAAFLGAATGSVVALVAGRPVWAANAKTEAALKAVVGAVAGFALSLALHHWLAVRLDFNAVSLGAGPAGQLAVVLLPAVATLLALFFELDHDGARSEPKHLTSAHERVRLHSPLDSELDSAPDSELDSAPDDVAEPSAHEREKH